MDKLTLFLKVNQRPTLPMQVRGANGRVFVQGIVEPDGPRSEPTVLRGLQSDFDRESLRLVGLFRAWQPTKKGGQRVIIKKGSKPVIHSWFILTAYCRFVSTSLRITSPATRLRF